jgi:hypothetical protein
MAMDLMHGLGVVDRPGKPEGAGRFRAVQCASFRMPSLVAERVDGEPMESDEVIHFDTASGVATGQGIVDVFQASEQPLCPRLTRPGPRCGGVVCSWGECGARR